MMVSLEMDDIRREMESIRLLRERGFPTRAGSNARLLPSEMP
jgi:hypothetical protein